MLFIKIPQLDIDVVGETRDELFSEFQKQIVMLWEEYATEEDANLTPSAQELKRNLLKSMKLGWAQSLS